MEALAEKLQAALSHRDVTIRDFCDIDYAVRMLDLEPEDPALVGLLQQMLAVLGNEPVDVSENRRKCHSFTPPRQALHFRSALHTCSTRQRSCAVRYGASLRNGRGDGGLGELSNHALHGTSSSRASSATVDIAKALTLPLYRTPAGPVAQASIHGRCPLQRLRASLRTVKTLLGTCLAVLEDRSDLGAELTDHLLEGRQFRNQIAHATVGGTE